MGNIEDPAKQEKIRRGPHQFVHDPSKGQFGIYVEKPYHHQEYPKVMDKTPCPQLKDFKGKPDADILLDNARKEWDTLQTQSIVHNKAEEEKWLDEHKDDQALTVQDRQYPKTMDRMPAPLPETFDTLEAYREAKQAWKEQVTASIVHDKDEEQLWLREHGGEAPKRKGKAKAA